MPRYVVDASVVAKWVLPDESEEVGPAKLKQDLVEGRVELHAPSIMPLEVANVLWRAEKAGRIARRDATEALRALAGLRLALHELGWDDIAESFELASSLDMVTYDAAYLLVSSHLKAPLITADVSLYEKSKAKCRSLLVRDY